MKTPLTNLMNCPSFPERQQQEVDPRRVLQGRRRLRVGRHPGGGRAGLPVLPRPHRRHLQVEGRERGLRRGRGRHLHQSGAEALRRLRSLCKAIKCSK